jgi:pimeloyl-ACP methyl ester carboxylesterase
MPALAVGGEKSLGSPMADVMRFAANNVEAGVVPNAGHWIMEENPSATISMVRAFLNANVQENQPLTRVSLNSGENDRPDW